MTSALLRVIVSFGLLQAQAWAVGRDERLAALRAMDYAGLDRFDEAERIAREMLRLFPGAVDSAGAPLDSVLEGIRLLGGPRERPR